MMSEIKAGKYQEHKRVEIEGFEIADATSSSYPIHDDLVWVGYGGMEGRWLTVDQALSVAKAITEVANHNIHRRGIASDNKQ